MNIIKLRIGTIDIEKLGSQLMQSILPYNDTEGKLPTKEVDLSAFIPQHLENVKPGANICVMKGMVWITQTNNSKDYILSSGESMVVTNTGRIVAQGWPQANLRISDGTRGARLPILFKRRR